MTPPPKKCYYLLLNKEAFVASFFYMLNFINRNTVSVFNIILIEKIQLVGTKIALYQYLRI